MGKKSRDWPAWRYGPDGQRRIFQENEPIPAGWVDHPSKVEAGGGEGDVFSLESASIPEIEAAYAEGVVTLEEIEEAEAARSRQREGIATFVATERSRLEARSDALSVLREAGVDISDDATDEELSAALDALEE